MAESHVVSGLVAKRAELAGLVAHHQKEIERIGCDLDHIDAAIKIFAPNIDLRTLRPKEHRQRNSYFTPGQAPRVLLDILRNTRKAMTSREMAEAVLAERGMEASAERLESLQKSILVAIKGLEGKKRVRVAAVGKGGTRTWELA